MASTIRAAALTLGGCALLAGSASAAGKPIYTYALSLARDAESYDRALVVACIQGIVNRQGPELYVFGASTGFRRPAGDWAEGVARLDHSREWYQTFRAEGQWLHGRPEVSLPDLDALVAFAGKRLQGAVIWDPDVPATVNVATTIAGIRDAVVLSPELAERYRERWKLPLLYDLRGRFTGKETGSRKNDPYRWAIREFLEPGLCSTKLLCYYPDSFVARENGAWDYVVCRDWAIKNRAFVFSLWPWSDEPAADEPSQASGTDHATFTTILAETMRQAKGRHLTEMAGFIMFYDGPMWCNKLVTKHPDGVYTEWETVWLISHYNTYQNTACGWIFNQSVHCHYRPPALRQPEPPPVPVLQNKTYACILMADYDSATPLYGLLKECWKDPARGVLPLAWGVNPNLVDTLPDLLAYYYRTAGPNDTFVSDASCAGYFNPNRVRPESLPLFVKHNRRYFRQLDMSIAGMVLDFDQPTPAVKDAFAQFAPDGYACITWDQHGMGGKAPAPQVWKGMPVFEQTGGPSSLEAPAVAADIMSRAMPQQQQDKPYFQYFRIVYTRPSAVVQTIGLLRAKRPELDLEVVGPQAFFGLLKQHLGSTSRQGD
jgi:hypothetical protein